MVLTASTYHEIVVVSEGIFAVWWVLFLGVHLITCGYNAAYALLYSELGSTSLSQNLESFHVGMSSSNYGVITAVHAVMASIHGICILSMVGSSLHQGALAFTPWGNCGISRTDPALARTVDSTKKHHDRPSFITLNSVSKITSSLTNRYGLLGVNGEYFHAVLVCRELIETTFQTIQAYRMSFLLPNILLNRFYVVALVLNCWSSAIVHALPFRQDEARKRFASLVCDCVLDLVSCMGVTVIVMLSYVSQYDPQTTDFGVNPWYNDEWATRALNEFQLVAVVSWSDLFSRTVFSLGVMMTTTNLKELLYYRGSTRGNRVSDATVAITTKVKVKVKAAGGDTAKKRVPENVECSLPHSMVTVKSVRELMCRGAINGVHFLFFVWGLMVLFFHIQASVHTSLPQCILQVRPWAVSRPSCFLLCLDCYRLGISGHLNEVDLNWHEFDGSTVVMMLIRHCPALEVPDIFNEFHGLLSIKIYNSTIVEWRDSVAVTNTNHPGLLSLMVVRVNTTDGVLPPGFLSNDIPQQLYDIEMCVTNLKEVPDDLDTKWLPGSCVVIEHSQLRNVPASLLRLMPSYVSLMGNPISTLPPEIFEIEGLTDLGIGGTDIRELPRDVTRLSSTLTTIYMSDTDISYFWPWVEDLTQRQPILAGGSLYCHDLERIANGSTDSFSISSSPDYSVELMDPANAVAGGSTWSAVDCSAPISGITGPLYPLVDEDNHNAINYPL
ncbi:hypothetical protein F442_05337 [Phytophthora nicotianae P10297]|uniref:Uncharacterized protein n=5 Tax=Phytophthora nicotianae TaxID=4792 RepID=W2ZPX5_PHYNI|nr:hypothetical protein F442_05337 [Phytophthora nicotianae P10297]KUF90398.1 hypothetical protein AM587_10012804 [Phytophthora nicotianae]